MRDLGLGVVRRGGDEGIFRHQRARDEIDLKKMTPTAPLPAGQIPDHRIQIQRTDSELMERIQIKRGRSTGSPHRQVYRNTCCPCSSRRIPCR